jgi:renalase
METRDILIIGAGICGLAVARRIRETSPECSVAILEKSAGVGGRLATRRAPPAIFDHGAQLYHPGSCGPWHNRWKKAGRIDEWTLDDGTLVASSRAGISDLAKQLAQGLEVVRETRVTRILRNARSWELETETGKRWIGEKILITAPIPQALDLLKNSKVPFNDALESLRYDPALVLLLGLERSPSPATPFLDSALGPIERVVDQEKKGVSGTPAWTVLFNAEFSSAHFDAEESFAKNLAIQEVMKRYPGLRIREAQLKKWRYSKIQKPWFEPVYVAPESGLFLAGDAFGGDGISGALRSAEAAFQRIISA